MGSADKQVQSGVSGGNADKWVQSRVPFVRTAFEATRHRFAIICQDHFILPKLVPLDKDGVSCLRPMRVRRVVLADKVVVGITHKLNLKFTACQNRRNIRND